MTLSQLNAERTAPVNRMQVASASDDIRLRALERLYARKAAVDELIDSLENYQRFMDRPGRAKVCRPLTGSRKS